MPPEVEDVLLRQVRALLVDEHPNVQMYVLLSLLCEAAANGVDMDELCLRVQHIQFTEHAATCEMCRDAANARMN